jgi:hypothetical protein
MEGDACHQGLLHTSFRFPSKGAPLQVPLSQPPYRGTLHPQSTLLLLSQAAQGPMEIDTHSQSLDEFSSLRSPHLRSTPATHGEKNTVTIRGAPHGCKAYMQWGVAWFPKGIIYNTADEYPRALLASMCQCNPLHGIPSTPVPTSHVTKSMDCQRASGQPLSRHPPQGTLPVKIMYVTFTS